MAVTGNYIASTDVNVKPVSTDITRAGWGDTELTRVIAEAEQYIESALVILGYTRAQLQTAPLVDTLCIKYSFYVIERDIFTQNSPSLGRTGGEEYNKWLNDVNAVLEQLKSGDMRLTTSAGVVIAPASGDARLEVQINTNNVDRAVTMGEFSDMEIDPDYYDDDNIGNGD